MAQKFPSNVVPLTPAQIQRVQNMGVPLYIDGAKGGHTFIPTENGRSVICANTPALSFPQNLGEGFSVGIMGAFTIAGSGQPGMAVVNGTASADPSSFITLRQTATGVYSLVSGGGGGGGPASALSSGEVGRLQSVAAYPGTDPSFLSVADRTAIRLDYTRPTRTATIVIAAPDSLDPYASDYIVPATGGCQDIISAAIASLRGIGGKVILRSGTYNITAPIVHDADWVTLEGEARGFWGRFFNSYSAQPNVPSAEGITGGVKIKQLTSGQNGIIFGTTYTNGDARHKGIAIKNLYMYGKDKTGTAIFGRDSPFNDLQNYIDISEIADVVIHQFNDGINVTWDTPFIHGNSIQDCAGQGIRQGMCLGTISSNIVFDIGGTGIAIGGTTGGTQVVGNTIGSFGASGIFLNGQNCTVVGNSIQGASNLAGFGGHLIEITKGFTAKGTPPGAGNTISGNVLSLANQSGLATPANTTGHGIYVHDGAYENAITGNTINGSTVNSPRFAVCLGNTSGTDTTAINNTVVGNVVRGGRWNNGGAVTIQDYSGGATNKIGFNVGDSRA